MGCHALLQGIFPTQGWNPRLLVSCIGNRNALVQTKYFSVVSIRLINSTIKIVFNFQILSIVHIGRINRGIFFKIPNGKESFCQCKRHKRHRFDLCVGKIPWRRAWQLTPVFLPGESPQTEEPGRLQSMWSQIAGHN